MAKKPPRRRPSCDRLRLNRHRRILLIYVVILLPQTALTLRSALLVEQIADVSRVAESSYGTACRFSLVG